MKLSCLTRRAAPANNRLYLLKPVLLLLRASSSGVVCVLVRIFFYNAQLSRMSHCAPVARKPICLEFTPEAAVGNILVA